MEGEIIDLSKLGKASDVLKNYKDGQPLSRLESRLESQQSGSFQGDSKYDQNIGYGINQKNLRARNQPVSDQIANAAIKTLPGVGLGILENAGYLGELVFDWDNNKEYSNIFTDLAKAGRDKLEQNLPVHRENPEQVFDLKDPAWWINNGQGLVESIGEFLVTGAGVGSALSKGAKALTTTLKAGELTGKVLQGAAQLSTASSLAYVEGAMSGAQVYKDVLEQTGDQQKASDAASKTVYLNTLINTGLNITSISPLFRSASNLDEAVKSQLSKKVKESGTDYITRLGNLESKGVTQASILKSLGLEAFQEGLEEDVNLFAENEGRITGGIRKSKGDALDRFVDSAFSEEGALNFMLGAIGGIAQTAGMEYLPLKNYVDENGNKQRTSARNLEGIEKAKYQKETISTFKKDIQYLQENQQALNNAVESGNKIAVDIAKNNLFNIATLKSIRNETSNELATEISKIAEVDNTQIRENGKTDAQNQGLTDNIDDNTYKEKAVRKASDIRMLNKEFRDLNTNITNSHVAAEAFRRRLNVYSANSVLEDINKSIHTTEQDLLKYLPLNLIDAAKYQAEVKAYDNVQLFQKGRGEQKESDLVQSESIIVRSLLRDLKKENPQLEQELNKIDGLLTPLINHYSNKLVIEKDVQDLKSLYNDILNNPKAFETKIDKELSELTKQADTIKKDKEKQDELATKQANIDEARQKKEEVKLQKEALERKEEIIQVPEQANQEDIDLGEAQQSIENIPILESLEDTSTEQLEAVNSVQTSYQGKTNKEAEEENSFIEETIETINNENNPTYGNHNKIAYKAQEQDSKGKTIDSTIINEFYKILHSPEFSEGTSVTLKVDKESSFYGENKEDINKIPIGVYYKDIFAGYLPNYRNQQKDLLLARNYIVQNGETKTIVSKKTVGVLNKTKRASVLDNIPIIPKFAIGVGGSYLVNVETPFNGELINKNGAKTGFIYTIVKTPNNKDIALPTDVSKVSEQIVDSVINVLDIFIKSDNLSEQNKSIVKEIFDKYGIDVTTQKGLQDYVNLFIYTTDLNDPENIIKFNLEQRDNHYVQVSQNGIRFMRSGGAIKTKSGVLQAREVGRNTPNPENFYKDLKNHLLNTYFRIDLTKLSSKKPFEAPILHVQPTGDLDYTQYYKNNYAEHVATNTTINVIGVKLNDKEQTLFVQPSIFLDFSFLSTPTEKSSSIIAEKTGQKVILASGKKGLKGLTKSLPMTKKDPNQVTLDDAKEAKETCK